jgi:putative endonuclease
MSFYTYLLASAPYGTLYCGHTDDLVARIWKHRERVYSGFTAKYGVYRLVWYEAHGEREHAFRRERRIKKWNRGWKVRLIEVENPTWSDLYEAFCGTSSADQSQVPLTPPPPMRVIGPSSVSLFAPLRSERADASTQLGSPPARG